MQAAAGAVTCRTLLGSYPATAALARGDVRSPLVTLAFADVRQTYPHFKAVVRDHAFDVAELAIVTYLQAHASGTPYVLLPVVVAGRPLHRSLLYDPARGRIDARDLAARRIGVRAYSQTSGAWVRGILEHDYGVDLRRVRWITFEEPHVRDYRDPPWVERAAPGAELLPMLLDGGLDAAIFGSDAPAAALAPAIADADEAAEAWARAHGGTPINHMVVVHERIVSDRPDAAREICRMLRDSIAASRHGGDAIRFGIERCRGSLDAIVQYAVEQALIPRRVSVDELFERAAPVIEGL